LQFPAGSWKFYGVIPEIDIWRAATLMLKRYGRWGAQGKRIARRRARVGWR
jgi:hypothetical protein